MKKFLAIVMALCLFATCAALAEAADEVTWDGIEEVLDESGVTGSFRTFDEIAVKIWLPDELQPVELTQEDRDSGFIGYFTDDEGAATVAVVYTDMQGTDVDAYAQMLADAGDYESVAILNINGLPAVRYYMPENDSLNIAFATEAGYILEVTMAPMSEEGADIVWGIVGASIQAE